jgi:2,5-diketo-D-gluconate reductase A
MTSMPSVPDITLNDGSFMPQLGFGVWQVPAGETAKAVGLAIAAGSRSIDTAMIYRNEEGVGDGVRTSGIPREQIFITTKLWNADQGYDSTLRAFDASLKRLRLDYVDLYLIHWPMPQQGRYADSWKAFVTLKNGGRAKSIGVSNFNPKHLQKIMDETGVVATVNQVELHPRFQQKALREFHAKHGIATESWSPLGRGALSNEPVLARIAKKHGKTWAQIVLRWHIELGLIAIPKSVTPARIRENISIFDFRLDAEDMKAIAALDHSGGRSGPDPDADW